MALAAQASQGRDGGERERKGRIGGRDIRKKKRREYNKRDEGGGEGREQR